MTILFAATAYALRTGEVKRRVTTALAAALNCDVTLDALDVRFVPTIRISGERIAIRLHDRPELPPIIEASRFTVGLGLFSMYRRHVDTVHLDGLKLNIPPPRQSSGDVAPNRRPLFSVSHIVAHDAELNFVGKMQNNRPLSFAVHNLDLEDASVERPMQFMSRVTNPMPEGLVIASGSIGPWNRLNPGDTPLSGNYSMPDGDLATVNGIGGRVHSTGVFKGQLTDIRVEGSSTTPDFSLDLGGKPMPLTTKFLVAIDGGTGTTRLDRVDATLGATEILVAGTVTNLPGPRRNDVTLAVSISDGRIEDLLKLVVDSPRPVILGDVSLTASLVLPPGRERARTRVQVNGTFGLKRANFTSAELQTKLAEISRRGQGKDRDEIESRVATSLGGSFSLKQGQLALPRISFAVPGAALSLSGRYTLGTEELQFTGTVRLKASLSKVVGGFKSIFIKPFNPLFRKGADGTVLPIQISGTRTNPIYGVRKKDIFKKDPKK